MANQGLIGAGISIAGFRGRFEEVVLLPGNKPMAPAEYTAFVSEFATLGAGVSKSAGIELELG